MGKAYAVIAGVLTGWMLLGGLSLGAFPGGGDCLACVDGALLPSEEAANAGVEPDPRCSTCQENSPSSSNCLHCGLGVLAWSPELPELSSDLVREVHTSVGPRRTTSLLWRPPSGALSAYPLR